MFIKEKVEALSLGDKLCWRVTRWDNDNGNKIVDYLTNDSVRILTILSLEFNNCKAYEFHC
jgi:hypothetical protein